MNLSKEDVLKALGTVEDPDLKKDLVSLGMISEILIEKNRISFTLVLTTPSCPLKNKMKEDCITAIKAIAGPEVQIEVEFSAKVTSHKPANSKENILSGVSNIIAVVSGKGGVGKSTVAANLALALSASGASVGLLDADIYGPSLPIMFDVRDAKPEVKDRQGKSVIIPIKKYGISLLSIGFFVDPEKALIWRGPMASSAIKQLFGDADWGKLDYLIIDTPPGTGDIHLTMLQSLSIAGVVIVTSPQEVALADARKAADMYVTEGIKVPVLGLVENMSYFTPAELPNNKYYLFGKDGGKRLAEELKLPLLGQIPIVQGLAEAGDIGRPIVLDEKSPVREAFMELAGKVSQQLSIWNALREMTDVENCNKTHN